MQNVRKAFEEIPELKTPTSRNFHQETKIKKLTIPLDQKKWPKIWTIVDFKSYPRFPYIDLPKPRLDNEISLRKTLINRHSTRRFLKKSLSLSELSSLLFYSSGIKGNKYIKDGERFYPSAGARYPLEIYPLVLNVKDLKPGVYHYYVKTNGLEELYAGNNVKKEILRIFNPGLVYESSLIVIISAVFYRNQIKYYERGYRHILSEVGFLSQNIYLLTEALGLGCCSLGGYFDDGLNKLIDLEEDVEAVVGAIAIGKKKILFPALI